MMDPSVSGPGSVSNPSFWEERYRAGQTGWDIGRPAPPFESLLVSPDCPPPGRLAVLGCGRGHDALLFARHGFTVTGFDFAPSAVQEAQTAAARSGLAVEFVRADLFTLPSSYSEFFDYVVEHTCFCAIDPSRRGEYVDVVRHLLRPGGEMIALFFAHGQPGGPPFTTNVEEIRHLFGDAFAIEQLEPARDSIESRRGKEVLGRLRRR